MNKTAVVALLFAFVGQGCTTEQAAAQVDSSAAPPKMVLLIGDGMDQHQITIARNYLVGFDGRLTLDTLPERSSVQTQTLAEEDPRVPEYVPD
jgi:alkaline phosphatase